MPIVAYPDPVLVRKAAPVDPGWPGLRPLVERMVRAMVEAEGVGLAAPQVGESLRVFVASETGDPAEALVCVNPTLENSGPLVEMEEGCLSLPGVRAVVQRFQRTRLTALDGEGREFSVEAEGLLARIFQHEFDHLEGILFFQRMTEADRMRIRADLRAFEEQYSPR